MNAVVLYSAAPATVADDSSKAEDTALELEGLLEEIGSLESSISEYESGVAVLTQKLRADNREAINEVDALQAEIEALTAKLESFSDDDDEDEDGCDDFFDEDEEVFTDYESANTEAIENTPDEDSGSVLKACKRLYLKIAKKCHPDKTKVPRLRDLFVQAHKAMQKYDLDELQRIHDSVFGESGSKASLMDRLIAARIKRDSLRIQWTTIQVTDDYKLYAANLSHGYAVAKRAYKNILALTRSSMKEQISSLKNALSAMEFAQSVHDLYGGKFDFDEDDDADIGFDENE